MMVQGQGFWHFLNDDTCGMNVRVGMQDYEPGYFSWVPETTWKVQAHYQKASSICVVERL